ncbi:hypothetical protein CYLTODRAFT_458010 [Cylindrobasidium torrendii FP15055 ss-10]|uniref:Uncharacterized protein n=1 Tax=Cylindrobasidium torrendii FP15055 ss-10 TaxID=1314674 RepID=A0A0D7B203_9AGAR|nr:hypothetical protein CYLTODRAFT_458010 [Cylindrobasidium torrendii FP15055 ss-10]
MFTIIASIVALALTPVAQAAVLCEPIVHGRLSASPTIANFDPDTNTSVTADGGFVVGGDVTDFTFENCQSTFMGYTSGPSGTNTTSYWGHIKQTGTDNCITIALDGDYPYTVGLSPCLDSDDQSQLKQFFGMSHWVGHPIYTGFHGKTAAGETYDNNPFKYYALAVSGKGDIMPVEVYGEKAWTPEPEGSFGLAWNVYEEF